MKVIGLTGGFGSGKTTVASIFRSLGARVLDADRVAHDAIRKGKPAHKAIVSAFGDAMLNGHGDIDRKKLAAIVFSNRQCLTKLNRIVHPVVIAHIKKEIRKFSGKKVVIIDAPLLIEARCLDLVDKLVVVAASRKKQVARCMKKFGMSRGEVLKRIRNQAPLKYKVKAADFVINNDGAIAETKKQVRKVWRKIAWK